MENEFSSCSYVVICLILRPNGCSSRLQVLALPIVDIGPGSRKLTIMISRILLHGKHSFWWINKINRPHGSPAECCGMILIKSI